MSQTLRLLSKEEWIVERILEQRVGESGKLEYKVKWAGYDEVTWEPPEHLEHAQQKVAEFKARSGPSNFKSGRGRKRARGNK